MRTEITFKASEKELYEFLERESKIIGKSAFIKLLLSKELKRAKQEESQAKA